MGSKKKAETTTTTTRTKAAVGRERRLALALRELLDATNGNIGSDGDAQADAVVDAQSCAATLLKEFGYSELESISRRVNTLEAQLTAASLDKDYAKVADLGKLLQRAQLGLPPAKAKAAGKSRTRTPPAPDAAAASSSES